MLRGLLFLGLALLPLPLQAETVSTFSLKNGLEVVVIEDHRAPVAVQMIWYKTGAADDPRGKSGIAHFLEHLMFKGTDTLAPGEFSATVEAQGGDDNAFTTPDQTAYFQRVAADRLPLMMQMEADRMTNLQMSEEDVATERQVILEERSQRVDGDPGSLFQEQLQATLYMNHTYGIPTIGWRHEMEGLTREDAFTAYKRFYAPNNAVLVIAGDVDPAEVQKLAGQHYGPIPPSDAIVPRARPAEPPQLAERRIAMTDPRVSQPYLIRSYLAPERNTGDQKQAAALTYLSELLGGSGTTSVLARALQFDDPKAVYTSAYYAGTSLDPVSFGLIVVPKPGVTLVEAEKAMDDVLAKFLKDGVEPAAFARIQTQLRAGEIYARDDVDGLARRYGAALTSGLTLADVQDWPKVLQAVTPEDVMAAARDVLNRNRAVTGWLSKEEVTP